MKDKLLTAFFLSILLVLAVKVSAVETAHFKHSTRQEFQEGEFEATVLDEDGFIRLLGQEKSLLTEEVGYVWDMTVGPGDAIYVATGEEGQIYKITPEAAEIFYKADDPDVLSLASDGKTLYAGTGPSGLILKINAQAEAEEIYRGEDEYIWDLALSGDGTLYAATGSKGRILTISPGEEAAVLFDSPQEHILSLLLDKDGILYGSSSPGGIIYKISLDQEAAEVEVLFDAKEPELYGLAQDDQGNLYASTAVIDRRPPAPEEGPSGFFTAQGRPQSQAGRPRSISPSRAAPVKIEAENAIYKIDASGNVNLIFKKKGTILLALFSMEGALYFGSGDDGELYRIGEDLEAVVVRDLDEAQITKIMRGPQDELLVATANAGKVYSFGPSFAQKGTYISEVLDAGAISKWGRISWRADSLLGVQVTLATRSGNTSEADETWSAWSEEHTAPEGEEITSPPARFIQYRATLTAANAEATPVLEEVSIAYLNSNQPPRVIQLDVGAEGARGDRRERGQGPKPPQEKAEPGKINISWKAVDPNNDTLSFNLYFRGEGERTWKLLEEDQEKPAYQWDTTSVPDGTYRVKVVASDAPSNPQSRILTHEKISKTFFIDNTPPVFKELTLEPILNPNQRDGKSYRVKAVAVDGASGIASASFSVDSQEFKQVAPVGEVFDSKEETIEFETEGLMPGEHTLVVKVTDRAGNVAAKKMVVVTDETRASKG